MQTPDSITLVLKEASRGLLYLSESDYPFDVVYIKMDNNAPLSTETLPAVLSLPAEAAIEETDLGSFLNPMSFPADAHDEQMQQDAIRFRQLEATLRNELKDIQVFRVGEIQIEVYILGYTEEGSLAGLHTTVIET
jgi:hypothetical protein